MGEAPGASVAVFPLVVRFPSSLSFASGAPGGRNPWADAILPVLDLKDTGARPGDIAVASGCRGRSRWGSGAWDLRSTAKRRPGVGRGSRRR